MRLFLAEDEAMMAEALIAYVSYHHHQVDWADNGTDALDLLQDNDFDYDCLILDVMMPGMDGVTLLKKLRAMNCTVPALFLTAKAEMADKAEGYHAGGDDYLTKPFAMEELLLRVNALAMRGKVFHSPRLSFANMVLDEDSCRLSVGDASCALSRKEYQLMDFLMRNPRIFFSVDTLLDRVWGLSAEVEQGTVWVHISNLRKKLESLGARASIVSRRNVGYALEENA